MFERRKLLVWGKTYPEFSTKYYETVCTGAVDTETGRLVRIYPITLRYMKEPFTKYDLIEAEIERNTKDRRPESHRINLDSIKKVGHLKTTDGWLARARLVLNKATAFDSLEALRAAEADNDTSLGLVAPKRIKRFYVHRKPENERAAWEAQRNKALSQQDLFGDAELVRKELNYIPIHYKVEFECIDPSCTGHNCTILDWEIYALSRKIYAIKGGAQAAERDVIAKLEQMCDAAKTKPHFFMGNTLAHPKSFSVTGFFYPTIAAYARLSEVGDNEARPPSS